MSKRKISSNSDRSGQNSEKKIKTHITRLESINPVDGRYAKKTKPFKKYCSEKAFFQYRFLVEIEWFKFLCAQVGTPLGKESIGFLNGLNSRYADNIAIADETDTIFKSYVDEFQSAYAIDDVAQYTYSQLFTLSIKSFEEKTHHDVKAIEYFIKKVCNILIPILSCKRISKKFIWA